MNYDLFIQPAVLERACVSTVSSGGQAPTHTPQHRLVSNRAAVDGTGGVANSERLFEGGPADAATEAIERTVAALSQMLEQTNVGLQYRVDDNTGDVVVSVINRDTGDVIRQLPPEQILKMRQQLQELMGVMFDVTA